MSEFMLYVQIGWKHVLDLRAYDHILFLAALVIPYHFKDWKKILTLVSVFTLGHTLALVLAVFEMVKINVNLVEFLIPVTILCTAVYNLFNAGKGSGKSTITVPAFITLFFGIIHGLGFSNYFNSILAGSPSDKLLPLLEFALGIEFAQLAVVGTVLILSFLIQFFVRNSKRNWVLIASSIIIGVIIPMLIESEIWKK
ncbi:HupE/UreJ family protein [Flavobacterium antarcticum]|uniref:HupE/UreJ family protein n=1 Tax=Flavobacterium antarcticum TaxID=271155 RepID=UPI0003B56B3A|nr:HupE/UreJ family protein [Flavobacterium antarcticum]